MTIATYNNNAYNNESIWWGRVIFFFFFLSFFFFFLNKSSTRSAKSKIIFQARFKNKSLVSVPVAGNNNNNIVQIYNNNENEIIIIIKSHFAFTACWTRENEHRNRSIISSYFCVGRYKRTRGKNITLRNHI